MLDLIYEHLPLLKDACRRHGVRRLELFGSAAVAMSFDPGRSDVDFIVTFIPGTDLGPWLKEYFALCTDLETILRVRVDLVMENAIQSPLFLEQANKTRRVIYASENTEAA